MVGTNSHKFLLCVWHTETVYEVFNPIYFAPGMFRCTVSDYMVFLLPGGCFRFFSISRVLLCRLATNKASGIAY